MSSPSSRTAKIETLVRRTERLEDLLENWQGTNPEPAQRELSALNWALDVIDAAEEQGLLDQLKEKGYKV